MRLTESHLSFLISRVLIILGFRSFSVLVIIPRMHVSLIWTKQKGSLEVNALLLADCPCKTGLTKGLVGWHTVVTLAFRMQRQEDCKFKASLGYRLRPCLFSLEFGW